MFSRWNRLDDEFVEQCLDSAARGSVIRREGFVRKLGIVLALTGAALFGFLAISGMVAENPMPPDANSVPILFMIFGFYMLSMSTYNLRLARVVDRMVPGPSRG